MEGSLLEAIRSRDAEECRSERHLKIAIHCSRVLKLGGVCFFQTVGTVLDVCFGCGLMVWTVGSWIHWLDSINVLFVWPIWPALGRGCWCGRFLQLDSNGAPQNWKYTNIHYVEERSSH